VYCIDLFVQPVEKRRSGNVRGRYVFSPKLGSAGEVAAHWFDMVADSVLFALSRNPTMLPWLEQRNMFQLSKDQALFQVETMSQ